jgi:hypothetical protein
MIFGTSHHLLDPGTLGAYKCMMCKIDVRRHLYVYIKSKMGKISNLARD